jgi:2-keto-4-pentenoate hydratase/2-oxohepta-3-ene-1,7-dioic acid hydratase in catechol pathway
MRIIRFLSAGKVLMGRPIDDRTAHRIDWQSFEKYSVTNEVVPIDRLLAPIEPVDILCIGVNYREHATETSSALPAQPLLFIKAGNTLNDPGAPIPMPRRSTQIDFEGELTIVIGKNCKDATRATAMDCIFGYTIANDVTARDWQRDKALGGGQFARGKSFDGCCPLGPAIVTRDEVTDPNNLKIKTTLNGQVMQDGTTADMIFDIPALIESLSSTMTLRAGAILLTGTPSGVGFTRNPPVFMKSGDTIAIEIEKLGRLENPVK